MDNLIKQLQKSVAEEEFARFQCPELSLAELLPAQRRSCRYGKYIYERNTVMYNYHPEPFATNQFVSDVLLKSDMSYELSILIAALQLGVSRSKVKQYAGLTTPLYRRGGGDNFVTSLRLIVDRLSALEQGKAEISKAQLDELKNSMSRLDGDSNEAGESNNSKPIAIIYS